MNSPITFGFLFVFALSATLGPGRAGVVVERLPRHPPSTVLRVQDSQVHGIFHGVGVVTAIEPGTGALTIDHGDIKGFMSAMEMTYNLRSPSLARGIAVGDRIGFDIDGKSFSITRVENLGKSK
jgi:Cu/Ag efflux protein CusF